MTTTERPANPYYGLIHEGAVWDAIEWVDLEAVNPYVGATVQQILDAGYCVCGHELPDHMPDGLLEEPGGCEWVWGDRSCLCRGFLGNIDPDGY